MTAKFINQYPDNGLTIKHVMEFVAYKQEYKDNDIVFTSFTNKTILDDLNDEERFYYNHGTLNQFNWDLITDISEFIDEVPPNLNYVSKFKSREILDGCNIVVSRSLHLSSRVLQREDQIFIDYNGSSIV